MSLIKQRFGITEIELQNVAKTFVDLIGNNLDYMNNTQDDINRFTTKLIMKMIDFHGKNWVQGLIGFMKNLRVCLPPMNKDQRKNAIKNQITEAILDYDLKIINHKMNEYVKYYE